MAMRLPTTKETILLLIILGGFIGYSFFSSGIHHFVTAAGHVQTFVSKTVNDAIFLPPPSPGPDLTGRTPRVMCMIFTTPGHWAKRGAVVQNTWSRHCYRRAFFYSALGPGTTHEIQNVNESVALNVSDGREHLSAKTMNALAYSYRNFANDTDWYMKADDDSYVIYRNLLKFLRRFNPSEASYLGQVIVGTMGHLPRGYNSGGGVYLLSRGSAAKVMTEGITKFPGNCKMAGTSSWEDVDTGDCLRALGVYPTYTLDSQKRARFESQFPLKFLKGIMGEGNNELAPYRSAKYNGMVFGNYDKAERMMSDESISFHYVSPAEMIFIDSLIS